MRASARMCSRYDCTAPWAASRASRFEMRPDLAGGHDDARRESLHVPLPRPGVRLVEVVQVDDEVALGGGEHAEVHQMCVAARPDLEPRSTGVRDEIERHHRRRAAVKSERRLEHAPPADGHELLKSRRVRGVDEGQRVAPALEGQALVLFARHALSKRLRGRLALRLAARPPRAAAPDARAAGPRSGAGLAMRRLFAMPLRLERDTPPTELCTPIR